MSTFGASLRSGAPGGKHHPSKVRSCSGQAPKKSPDPHFVNFAQRLHICIHDKHNDNNSNINNCS